MNAIKSSNSYQKHLLYPLFRYCVKTTFISQVCNLRLWKKTNDFAMRLRETRRLVTVFKILKQIVKSYPQLRHNLQSYDNIYQSFPFIEKVQESVDSRPTSMVKNHQLKTANLIIIKTNTHRESSSQKRLWGNTTDEKKQKLPSFTHHCIWWSVWRFGN